MRTNIRKLLVAVAALLLLGAGIAMAQAPAGQAPAGQAAAGRGPAAPPSLFRVMSPAYTEGSMIPSQYTCADPMGASPALQWTNPPAAAMSFAVIFHDTDAAPGKNTLDVTHWIFWNIPGTSTSVAAGVKPDSSPDGIVQGKNVRNVNGFQPPCPGVGAAPHHYVFELYALDGKLDLPAGSTRADLLKAMDGHVVGKATYFALFGR